MNLKVGQFYTYKSSEKHLTFLGSPMARDLVGQNICTNTPGFCVKIINISDAYNSIDGVLEFAFVQIKFQLYIFDEPIVNQYYHWGEDFFKKVFNEQ